MTRMIFRPLLAIALAAGMLAAVSNPSLAALSTADRTNAVVAPATESVASVETPAPQKLAAVTPVEAAPVVKAATPVVKAPVAARPHRAVARTVAAPRFASASRFGYGGYPCR